MDRLRIDGCDAPKSEPVLGGRGKVFGFVHHDGNQVAPLKDGAVRGGGTPMHGIRRFDDSLQYGHFSVFYFRVSGNDVVLPCKSFEPNDVMEGIFRRKNKVGALGPATRLHDTISRLNIVGAVGHYGKVAAFT